MSEPMPEFVYEFDEVVEIQFDVPGIPGLKGEPGEGIPVGGATGQFVRKAGVDDFNTEWADVTPATIGADTAGSAAAAQTAATTHADTQDDVHSTADRAYSDSLSAADRIYIDNEIAGLSTVATTGAYSDLSGLPTLGTAASKNTTAFATAAQGAKADTAVQDDDLGTAAYLDVPATGDAIAGQVVKGNDSRLSNARNPTYHTHTKAHVTDFSDADYATTAQGALADSAVQPADLGTAASLDVAAAGDAAVGEVVKGDDTRLSDARTPTAHTHPVGELDATGTADGTTYLRGDGTWATPAGGGSGYAPDPAAQPDGKWLTTESGAYVFADAPSGGHQIQDEGTPLAQLNALNFVGAGVTVTNEPGDDANTVYSSEVTTDSPLLWWRFTETVGATAEDATVANLDGTYVNSPTLDVAGPINKAISLAGTNQEVTRAGSASFDPDNGDVSIEIWYKGTDTGNATNPNFAGSAVIVAAYEDASNKHWMIDIDDSGYVRGWHNNTPAEVATTTTVNDNVWHHIVFVLDGGASVQGSLYVDGTLAGVGVLDGVDHNGTPPVRIGRNARQADSYLVGSVAEFAIYGSVLPQERIAAHYAARLGTAGATTATIPGVAVDSVSYIYERFYNSKGIPTPVTVSDWQEGDLWVIGHFAHKDKPLASEATIEALGNGFTVVQWENGTGANPGRLLVAYRFVTAADIATYQNTIIDLGFGTGSDAKYAGGSFIIRGGRIGESVKAASAGAVTTANVTAQNDGALALAFAGSSHGGMVLTTAQGFVEIDPNPDTSLPGFATQAVNAGAVTAPTWDSSNGTSAITLVVEPDSHPEYALTDGGRGNFATVAQGALADSASQPGHTHTEADISDLGAYPDATGQPATKVPQTDGANGWTFVDTPAGGGSGGHIIQDEGIPLTARDTINFTGAGVTASDESVSVYPGTVTGLSPTAYFTLGDSPVEASATMADFSGNGRDGTYYGGTSIAGLRTGSDTAVDFDGIDDYAQIPDGAWMDSASLSISAIIKPGDVSGVQQLVCRDSSASVLSRNFQFRLNGSKLEFVIFAGTTRTAAGATTLVPGTTYKVGGSYDSATGVTKVYVDGVEDGSHTGAATALATGIIEITIGARRSGALATSVSDFYHGVIDEVSIFDTVLSASNMADLDTAADAPAGGVTTVTIPHTGGGVSIPPFVAKHVVGIGTLYWYNYTGSSVSISNVAASLSGVATTGDTTVDILVDDVSVLSSPLTISLGQSTSGKVAESITIPDNSRVSVDVTAVAEELVNGKVLVQLI